LAVYAIGDVHGCLDSLEKLFNILPLSSEDVLIFLGDYIDRGPDSKGVINFLISLSKEYRCIFIRGNHEEMFLNAVLHGKDVELWYYNGAFATVRSYGSIASIPGDHIDFISSTIYYHILGNFLFVHAGVKPGIPLEDQSEFDLTWIRDEFIYSSDPLPGFKIIFGHTPFEKPLVMKNKIGIDTGCVYGGKLTALKIENMRFYQVECR